MEDDMWSAKINKTQSKNSYSSNKNDTKHIVKLPVGKMNYKIITENSFKQILENKMNE
jgi:carbon monoxide dehydrogenase subunit G